MTNRKSEESVSCTKAVTAHPQGIRAQNPYTAIGQMPIKEQSRFTQRKHGSAKKGKGREVQARRHSEVKTEVHEYGEPIGIEMHATREEMVRISNQIVRMLPRYRVEAKKRAEALNVKIKEEDGEEGKDNSTRNN